MKNLSTPHQKTMKDILSIKASAASVCLKKRCIFLATLLFIGAFVYAQAPTISYNSPQTYTPGTAITPLVPTSSGVAAVGYSTNPVIIGSGFTSVYGVASDAAGNVYMTDPGSGQIKKIPAGGGSPVIVLSGRINGLKDLALDTLGNLFFTDGNHKAFEFILGLTGKGGAFPVFIFQSWGIAADNNGLVFVTDYGANRYDLIELRTSMVNNAPGESNLPTGIAVDDADNLYIANSGSNLVRKFNAYAGVNNTNSTIGSGFNKPNGVALDFARDVFVADQGNNAVKMVPAGNNTPVIIGSGFNAPTGVATDGAGYVYVADNGNNEIKKISPVGGYYIGPTFLPPGLSFDNTTGIISGTPTGSFAAKKYTITAYNSFGSTSTSVIIGVKNSVDLASLAITPGTLNPSFSPGTTIYSVVVDKSITAIGVAAKPVDATAIVKITGQALKIGLNTLTIMLTSKDGLSSKTYTIYVTRGAPSSNAFLSQIQPNAGHLSPYFTPAITNYADTVANNILSIRITPASSFPLATIKVNGTTVNSDSLSQAIPLAQGLNTITTVVTAQDGASTKTYTVAVFRQYSSDANLTFMQPTAGFMAPVFTPVITSYNDTVNYTNLALEITPVADDSLAKITVNGMAVASGSMSQAISLNEGLNTITTVVTAPDGHTTKTFTISVMRVFSTDAFLTQIQPSAGMMSPVFNPMTTGYTDAVNNTNAAITITPVVDDPLATLTVNGAALAPGATSPAISLAVGSNTINTIVTAPDGVTTKTYTLTVTRAAPILGLLKAAYQPVGVAIINANPALADDGLLVHQGISPNGDGINDFLVIENITNYPDNKLSIMNRNGQLIFEAKGYDNSSKVFDGHSNKSGQMQLPGTYFYQLEYRVKGILKHKTGFIVLKY